MNLRKRILPIIMGVLMVTFIITGATVIKTVHAAKDENIFRYMDTFTQALHLIKTQYVEEVEDKKLMYGAIRGMLKELDPHSNFLSPKLYKEFMVETKGEFGGLGITIGLRDNMLTVIAPLEDTPAFRAGLHAGDKIIQIEKKSTLGMTLNKAVETLRGKPGTTVNITILRKDNGNDQTFDVKITRAIIKIISIKQNMIGDIGYIRMIQFSKNVSGQLKEAMRELETRGAKSFIIDLRNNPGGYLDEAIKVSSIFLESGKSVVYTKDRSGREQHYNSVSFTYRDTDRPLILLINEGSASASEIFSGAVQDHKRGLLIGSKSYGKASVQSIMRLQDGAALKLTTAKYYTPKGRMIHTKGLTPDFEVKQPKIKPGELPKVVGHTARVDLEKDVQLKFAVDKMKEQMKANGTAKK